MIKKPFFGFMKTKLKYPVVPLKESFQETPLPKKSTIYLKDAEMNSLEIKTGERVKTGQKLIIAEGEKSYFISPVTGTISKISQHTGYLGEEYPAIEVDVDEADQWDDEFEKADKSNPAEIVHDFLQSLPGACDLGSLLNPDLKLETIIINGLDFEPLVLTNQSVVRTGVDNIKKGVDYLKKITSAGQIIITAPPYLAALARESGVEVKVIQPVYPDTLPEMIMAKVLGKIVPQGGSCEDMGLAIISAEGVASLGKAFAEGKVPVEKKVTVISKEGKTRVLESRIGTPVKDLLDLAGIDLNHGDRLVFGGPMRGFAVFSEEAPIMPDTDAVMAQDSNLIVMSSGTPCVNCGECVRACPTKVPVNMLVRLLENSLYEEAVRDYDLLSCIECGLCSYACIARIPVFHYIMLGKSEYAKMQTSEGSHA